MIGCDVDYCDFGDVWDVGDGRRRMICPPTSWGRRHSPCLQSSHSVSMACPFPFPESPFPLPFIENFGSILCKYFPEY